MKLASVGVKEVTWPLKLPLTLCVLLSRKLMEAQAFSHVMESTIHPAPLLHYLLLVVSTWQSIR